MNGCNQLSPNEKLIFLHIPKVAGTSIRETVFRNSEKKYFWHSTENRLHDCSLTYLSNVDIIGGHITMYDPMVCAIERKIGSKNAIFAAAFREPVAHLISHFYHIQKHPNHHMYYNGTFSDALKADSAFNRGSRNLQTSYIVNTRKAEDVFKELASRRFILASIENIDEFAGILGHLVGVEDLTLSRLNEGVEKGLKEEDIAMAEEYCQKFCREDRFLYEFIRHQKNWLHM